MAASQEVRIENQYFRLDYLNKDNIVFRTTMS